MKKFVLFVLISIILVQSKMAIASDALLGIHSDFDKEEITLVVRSNGCTSKKDISVSLVNDKLILIRVNPDPCKKVPFGEKLVYTLKELKIDPNKPFSVENEFVINPMAAQ